MLIEIQRTPSRTLQYVHSLLLDPMITNRLIQEKLQEIIPWPVKSGNCKDVSESAVEEFFRKAIQETTASKLLRLFNMECLRWHADRIPRMFGALEDKALANLFHTVAHVVIKMRDETRR
jgi:hypothetical protein